MLGPPGAGKGTNCTKLVETMDYFHISVCHDRPEATCRYLSRSGLQAGDCLREERNNPNSKVSCVILFDLVKVNAELQDGELINSYIKDGKIVPVEITIKLMLAKVLSNSVDHSTVIRSYPRWLSSNLWEKPNFSSMVPKAVSVSSFSQALLTGFPRNENNKQGWEQVACISVYRVSVSSVSVLGIKVVGDKVDLLGVLFYDTDEATVTARIMERGKTSGRVDDNAASMVKRLKT